MNWEAAIIELLQNNANGFLNGLMLFLTEFGGELFFFLLVAVLYWCVNKRLGYKFLNVYLLGTAVNAGIKALIKRPRPFVKYPKRIFSIGSPEPDFSFPSGHSQSIANLSTQFAMHYKKKLKIVLPIAIILCLVVMFTRLYLGQHYLTDVLVGIAAGCLFAFVFSYLYELLKDKEHLIVLVVAPLCVLLTIILSLLFKNNVDANIFKVLGAYLAFSVGYYTEKRFVRFNPIQTVWWKNVLKMVIGLGVAFALKELLKLIFPIHVPFLHDFLRYFLLAIWASLGACALFKAIKL